MSEGQMNTIVTYVPMYFEVDKGPNKNGRQVRFNLPTAYWEPSVLVSSILAYLLKVSFQKYVILR